MTHFEYATVWSGPLVAVMPACILGKAAQLGFGVDRSAEFVACRQKSDEIG